MSERDTRCGHCWHQPEWQQCFQDIIITADGVQQLEPDATGEVCINYKRQPTCGECGHYEAEQCTDPDRRFRNTEAKRHVSFVHPACDWPGETHFETADDMIERLTSEAEALNTRAGAKTAELLGITARKARLIP